MGKVCPKREILYKFMWYMLTGENEKVYAV